MPEEAPVIKAVLGMEGPFINDVQLRCKNPLYAFQWKGLAHDHKFT
jgi:hypothetical protein